MIFETSQAVLPAGEVCFLSISTNSLNLFLSIVGKFYVELTYVTHYVNINEQM